MIKIIYFDEYSATDYLVIYDGGEKTKTAEDVKEKSKEIASKTEAGIFAKLSWLPFLGGEASTELSANFSYDSASLIKTTLSNTVLTDFLDKSQNDHRIFKLDNYTVYPYKNSIAYFKMITPYMVMTSSNIPTDEGVNFELSKVDEAFENAKGYYELIAEKNSQKIILRFNINAFRNNYNIADLPKMLLSFYAIKVGNTSEYLLDINKEFSGEVHAQITSIHDLEDDSDSDNKLDVYDVILAGIVG